MSLLLYCVALETAADTSVHGVGDAAVRSEIQSVLRFFFSEIERADLAGLEIATAAREVHRVVSDLFSKGAVLPFRYPTIVEDSAELAKLAEERGGAFREFLLRVAGKVQMDIRLTLAAAPDEAEPSSGREYMEARVRRQALLMAAAQTCREAALSPEWRNQQAGENIRCQALIERVEVISFLERMRTLELPGGVKAVVTGPWPPAGFWEGDPR